DEGVGVDGEGGGRRTADHVLLGTGYRIDVTRLPVLAPELRAALRVVGGYPVLDRSYQSSIPGLHFVGAPAAWSFGPLMRFVAGTQFVARNLTNSIRGKSIRQMFRETEWTTMAKSSSG